jgi:hypothetical protein
MGEAEGKDAGMLQTLLSAAKKYGLENSPAKVFFGDK